MWLNKRGGSVNIGSGGLNVEGGGITVKNGGLSVEGGNAVINSNIVNGSITLNNNDNCYIILGGDRKDTTITINCEQTNFKGDLNLDGSINIIANSSLVLHANGGIKHTYAVGYVTESVHPISQLVTVINQIDSNEKTYQITDDNIHFIYYNKHTDHSNPKLTIKDKNGKVLFEKKNIGNSVHFFYDGKELLELWRGTLSSYRD